MDDALDVIVVGAGAAGLMTAIVAARGGAGRIVALDGARTIGAKILVAGGGRCNVTHHTVDERAFAGSTPAAIRRVLRRFDVPRTIEFFRELGVELKQEDTGKLFPVTDRARTVLDALLRAAREAGAELRFPWRVETVRSGAGGFVVEGPSGRLRARRLVLATGGRSLPKSGSDGHGYEIAHRLGHTITERVFPALVPLVLPDGHFVRGLSGVAVPAAVEVRSASGRKRHEVAGDLLCTHFGLSGPVVLDASRHYLDARASDPGAHLVVRWLADESFESADRLLLDAGPSSVARALRERLPERLARAICAEAGVDPSCPGRQVPRTERRLLAHALTGMTVPVAGDRGFAHAEVTAGGVPLREVHLATMESRVCPGLHLAGEICDVDGRIGGFNFQWAWASGYVAGTGIHRGGTERTEQDRGIQE